MLLPGFVFHTTDGLRSGEAVLLSSNMLFKKNVSWFFQITKKPNCKPWCLLYLIWCGHTGISLWLTNVSKSPELFLC